MNKTLCSVLCGLLLLGVLLWRSVHHSGEIVTDLIFGWIAFLVRVCPTLDVRWDGVAVLGFGLVAITGISHYLLRWLTHEMRRDADHLPRVWRIRWTIVLVGFIVVMFTAGISVTGATHQIVWLLRSDEALFSQDLPQSYRSTTTNRLKFLGLGLSNHSDMHGALPTQWRAEPDTPRQSWVTQILPFLNYRTETIDERREWDHPINAHNFRAILPELLNPHFRTPTLRDPRGFALNHYAGNSRVFDRQERLSFEDVHDGATNTLMIGEVNSRFVAWGRPANSRDPAKGIDTVDGFGGAPGSHGVMFLMLDGSVRFVGKDVDPKVLDAIGTPAASAAK